MKFPVRFSLRNLLLFTVAGSILSTVVGLPYAEYRRELAIGRRLEERGCWIDWKPSTKHWGADFFTRIGLGRAFWRIRAVEFKEDGSIKNDDLQELSELTGLVAVSLRDTTVNDDGLSHLNGCTSLRELDLKGNISINDAGLRNLNLTDLEFLNVDATNATYEGIRSIVKQNPMLDEPTLIGRHALDRLKDVDFDYHRQVALEWALDPNDSISVQPNSRREWRNAGKHLQAFPGLVIAPFHDLPESAGPEIEWGLTLDILILNDDGEATIRPSDVRRVPRRHTKSAVAVIPPIGMTVSRLSGSGEIRAWFGEPDWHWLATAGDGSLEIATSVDIVFVDATSLPVTVHLTPLP